jgi:hypothetical protein
MSDIVQLPMEDWKHIITTVMKNLILSAKELVDEMRSEARPIPVVLTPSSRKPPPISVTEKIPPTPLFSPASKLSLKTDLCT